MLWYELVIYFITVLISELFLVAIFANLTNNHVKDYVNKKNVVIIVLLSVTATINSIYNNTLSKNLIQILIIFFINYSIFKLEFKKVLFYTLLSYFTMLIMEVFCSVIFMIISIENAKELNNHIILKSIFSFIVMLSTYLIIRIKNIRKIIMKIFDLFNKLNDTIVLYICVTFIVLFSLIAFSRSLNTSSFTSFLFNTLPLLITIIIIVLLFIEKNKLKKSISEQEVLLNFISEYEKIIDDDRIKRHEMLNNLLVLKSFPNRNTKEYMNTIDKFIESYESKGIKRTRNIYNLPSGLKGIIFYKFHDIEDKKINITSNISTPSVSAFNILDSRTYVRVCKIIGILLDNAIEASSAAKNKEIVLELYKEKGNIIFYLENTFKGKIDLSKINKNHYSTKGENRGYGLYLVNKIINKSNNILIEQSINKKKFITILKIKIKNNE